MIKCISCNIKYPSFNHKGEKKPLYCKECKLEGMVDVKNKKCISCNIKYPSFNHKGFFSFDKENKMKICNKKEYKHRIDTLFETINKYITYQEDVVFEEIKLFYNK